MYCNQAELCYTFDAMFTEDQIKQLRQVIQEEVRAEGEAIRKDLQAFKEETAINFKKQGKNIRAIRNTQDVMLRSLDREQMQQRKRIERVEKRLDLEPMEFEPGTASPI